MATKPRPPGQPTRAEQTAAKVAFVRRLFDESQSFGMIKKAFALEFKCSPRTAEPFYKLAKEEALKELGADSIDELRSMSAQFYLKLAGNVKANANIRLRARENFDRLYGLHAPTKVASTDTTGKDIPIEQLSAGKARLAAQELLNELRATQEQEGPPPCAESPA